MGDAPGAIITVFAARTPQPPIAVDAMAASTARRRDIASEAARRQLKAEIEVECLTRHILDHHAELAGAVVAKTIERFAIQSRWEDMKLWHRVLLRLRRRAGAEGQRSAQPATVSSSSPG